MKKEYRNIKLIKKSVENILKVIKPGDVVNTDGKGGGLFLRIGYWGIRAHQKALFKNGNWRDTHTTLYFDEHDTFSVEPPRATYLPLKCYCLDNISIYRYTKRNFNKKDILIMEKACDELYGTFYDFGQLLDVAINQILGYDHAIKFNIFDFGKGQKICSVGIRNAYEKLRKTVEPEMERLFNKLNPEKWTVSQIEKFERTNVEATSPAHFANSNYFNDEFKLIARFNMGKRIKL